MPEKQLITDGKLSGKTIAIKDTILVTNQIKFIVNILGATMFEVEGYGEELYNGDQLISFNSKTIQNKKEKFVRLTLDNSIKTQYLHFMDYPGAFSIFPLDRINSLCIHSFPICTMQHHIWCGY